VAIKFKRNRIVDPVGWDKRLHRVHDIEAVAGGRLLLHFSTCWCREARGGNRGVRLRRRPESG
jgi:hypothetical protein